jgi:hypothetical protein
MAKNVDYFCILKKLSRVNNQQFRENSPNLVTLFPIDIFVAFQTVEM